MEGINTMIKEKMRKNQGISWGVLFIICLLVQFLVPLENQYYDASDYWGQGVTLWSLGKFDLTTISGWRGYIFPLYLGLCNHYMGGGYWMENNKCNNGKFLFCYLTTSNSKY